jgi:probable phosphoglycerate mutase
MSALWLIRHGETEWAVSGRHTGLTDLDLTPRGVRQGELLAMRLSGKAFVQVRTSPLVRASETCRLAGYGDRALTDPDLVEWDYGVYEGRTTAEIRREVPGWVLWDAGAPGGETADQVGARADRVIDRFFEAGGDVALFAHGHVLRVLAARWLGLAPSAGRALSLHTTSVSILSLEREERVIRHWNEVCHLKEDL